VRARTRNLVLAVSTLLLGGVGPLSAPSPAAATVTRLCYGYSSCASAGMSAAGYASANGTMYWRMYSGHNCTNYAAYRMVLSGLPNERPWTGSGNATYWGTSMASITDHTPMVGSVAWWKAGVYPAGSAGHVAYVERVISPDEIIVSQDSWGGDFSWARITRTSSGWPSGFVHFNDVRIQNVAQPTITGRPRVGALLTATTGAWSPNDVTTTYQWRAGGQDIPGATSSTFRLTEAQLDQRVRVRVTASEPGYPTTTVASPATERVSTGSLQSTTAPSIGGEPRVDATLTADPGEWSPAPDSLTYQWLADGSPLPGADQPSLTPDPSLVGKALSVTVTAHRSGYADVPATSAATAPVARAQLTLRRAPAVAGTPQPGQTLSLDIGSAAPDATPHVVWLRSGEPVPGATATTYRVTTEDLGSRLRARVRWTRPGYATTWTRTTATPRVRVAPRVELTTTPSAGRVTFTTTVTSPDTSPDGTVRVWSDGALVGEGALTDGVATTRVTGLSSGEHRFRVVVSRTLTTTRLALVRRVDVP
jgi:surface antigen